MYRFAEATEKAEAAHQEIQTLLPRLRVARSSLTLVRSVLRPASLCEKRSFFEKF
jgi:hypothetical protein